MYLFFFFSSRRRHTRYIGDWSSDVCSSDLKTPQAEEIKQRAAEAGAQAGKNDFAQANKLLDAVESLLKKAPAAPAAPPPPRSEERRVGKEGRRRWSAYDETTKRQEMNGQGD